MTILRQGQRTVFLNKQDSNEPLLNHYRSNVHRLFRLFPGFAGCVATGRTREEIEREMREAIEFHIEGLRLAGEQVPEPRSQASYCDIAA